MAAYAAVASLMGTIHLLSQSSLDLLEVHKKHFKLLTEKVGSLLDLLYNNSDDKPTMDLLKKIKDLANEAEDEVELLVQLVMEKDEHVRTEANERLLLILQQAIQDFDLVMEELSKQRNNNNVQQAVDPSLGGSSSPRSHDYSTLENEMVGYNIEQESMRGQLTGHSSPLEVISISGMGGIGKSTFAKRMFSDPSVVSFFDIRGWITVSKVYNLRKILLSLLRDAGVNIEEELHNAKQQLDEVSDGDLADRLQKSLKGRRYLIVLDDIWSTEAWEEFRLWFPEYTNRSRILLTTRDVKVAQYASYPKDPFLMRFLEPEESWNLFCQKAFDKKVCPVEFESAAKEVVQNCRGLPLMISVVAGTLSSKRMLDEWRKVAESVSSLVNLDDYQRCSGVLALSYNHLPSHLKACFLYFGVFPKASEISVNNLMRLWVAEGFLELRGSGELGKVAANFLHDLIDKSLIVVSKRSLDGKVKTCRIHDLLHDLCLRESESENLLYVSRRGFTRDCQRVTFYTEQDWSRSIPTYCKTRSIHFPNFKMTLYVELRLSHFKLLRVLDMGKLGNMVLPSDIKHLVFLRYLAVWIPTGEQYLPIYNLRNLQTFISHERTFVGIHLPTGIWKMSQLRHLCSAKLYLNSPPKVSANDDKHRVLENLQSISGLVPRCCTKEIFEGIPKVKKLGIFSDKLDFFSKPGYLDNLVYLHELEELSIKHRVNQENVSFLRLPCPGSFPPNLKKLKLCNTLLPWEDMTIISKLPKLEVLQLKKDAFEMTTVWEVTEQGFPELKLLLLEELSLDYWRAADDYFPCLEHIIIRKCSHLLEIPEGFVDSMTLQLIELHQCSPSLVNSAERIQKEQLESLGNDMIKVHAFDTIRGSGSDVCGEQTAEKIVTNCSSLSYITGIFQRVNFSPYPTRARYHHTFITHACLWSFFSIFLFLFLVKWW